MGWISVIDILIDYQSATWTEPNLFELIWKIREVGQLDPKNWSNYGFIKSVLAIYQME